MSKPRVLIVDDEKQILSSLSLNLGRHFDVVTESDSRSAVVRLVEGEPFDVVLSDVRMPEIDGISFLRRARELAPTTVRVLLTGYADLGCAIAAVNEAQVFRILTKPCATPELVAALDDAVQSKMMDSTDVNEVAVEGLPGRIVNLDRYAKIGHLALESLTGLQDVSALLHAIGEQFGRLVDPDAPLLAEMLDDLRWASGRVNEVSGAFRELRRPVTSHETIVDIGAVVNRVTTRLRKVGADRGVELVIRESETESDIRMSEGHLEQVLVNLLLNAFAAARMSDKGPRVDVEVTRRQGNLVVIVRDNGPGIHPKVERRLFEPYASGDEQRVGLGLAVSRQLAMSMGAELVFERPAVGQGAAFHLVFERASQTATLGDDTEISEAAELKHDKAIRTHSFDQQDDTAADHSPVNVWVEETARLAKDK